MWQKRRGCVLTSSLLVAAMVLAGTNQRAYAQRRAKSTQTDHSAVDNSAATKTIAVLGSSVARGWVTSYEAKQDLLNGYAFRLERLLKPQGWKVVNISNPGDDTKDVLARIERDLIPTSANIVIIGLSMSNEGLETAKNPDRVLESYERGLKKIIEVCRKNGIAPVVGLCYPNDNYDAKHYAAIKEMNARINTLDVPSINFLGPVDNGSGGWVDGYTFDLDHPDDVGHQAMFHAIVPSLFDAMLAGKPTPTPVKSSAHITVKGEREDTPVSFIPEDVILSFTVAVQVRPSSGGCLIAVKGQNEWRRIEVEQNGKLRYTSSVGQTIVSPEPVTDGNWHDVAVCHRYLRGETELFLDGESLGKTEEVFFPVHFAIGGCGTRERGPESARADYRELLIYRSPLNEDEVKALHEGKLLQASLEVYAPLNDGRVDTDTPLVNLAQSMSKVVAYPTDTDEQTARLAGKCEETRNAKRYIDPDEKKPINVDPAIFDAYVGEYQVDPNFTLVILNEKGRLLLSPNRMGRIQLYPESETRFFARIMGPRIAVTFVKGQNGKVNELVFHQDNMKIPAKRVR